MTQTKLSRQMNEELQGSPLGALVAPLVEEMVAQRYACCTVVNHQLAWVRFGRWLRHTGRRLEELNETAVQRFMASRSGRQMSHNTGAALRQLLGATRRAGVTPAALVREPSPAEALASAYRHYLTEERGLAGRTADSYVPPIALFLQRRFGTGPADTRQLTAPELVKLLQGYLRQHSRGYARIVQTTLRCFLRFLRYRGDIVVDLAAAVPAVAYWEEGGLPKYLPAPQVRRTLARCDRTTALGRRNYAILQLLAQMGLRASEVLALRLEDLDWNGGRLRVRSVKQGPEIWMPLPVEAGAALADYLHAGRPACASRVVFVRAVAPYVPLSRAGDISNLVRQALEHAGVKSRCTGAHVLRHSLAVEMMRQGASLEKIGWQLRHATVGTTRVYAKVDVKALRMLAVAWPGGVR